MLVRRPKSQLGHLNGLRKDAGPVLGAIVLSGLLHGLCLLLLGRLDGGFRPEGQKTPIEFDLVELVDGAKLASKAAEPVGAGRPAKDVVPTPRESSRVARKQAKKQARSQAKTSGLPEPRRGRERASARDTRNQVRAPGRGKGAAVPMEQARSLLAMRGPSPVKPEQGRASIIHNPSAMDAAIVRPTRGSVVTRKISGAKSSKGSGRRFGDYVFHPEADGKLTYRDPQSDFLAVLMPNGDIEFETRAPVLGGICAVGVCVQVGGLRGKNERKRKLLNRVRVRFAPVPLGLGGSFGSLRGVNDRKLELMRATFPARLQMRIEQQKRRQKRALHALHDELERIVATQPNSKARSIIIARALELDGQIPEFAHADDRNKEQLRSLFDQKRAGALAMCQKILRFVRRHQERGFRPDDVRKVERHCRALGR